MDPRLVCLLLLPMAMSLPFEDLEDRGVGLDIEDFANGDKIDTENEIPDDEDPLNDMLENGDGYQGDMILDPEEIELFENGNATQMRAAYADRTWPKINDRVIIPYQMNHAQFSKDERANIARAIEEYEKYTCIRIIPRTTERDYVNIYRGTGCSSQVGKQGGSQQMSLKSGCANNVGIPIHEFMHAIGYKHEQARSDRDKWVEIKWNNIQKGKEHNFDECDGCDLQGLPYDTGSLMHYHAYSFAIDRSKPTIVLKNGGSPKSIGQRNGFSELDLAGINELYCQDTCYVDKRSTEYCEKKKKKCNGNRVKENCARTCEVCTSGLPCEDHKDDCKKWKGDCDDKTWGGWMANNCPKTCGVCKSRCKDKQATEDCKRWAKKRCNSKKWGTWMKEECAKTCGVCS